MQAKYIRATADDHDRTSAFCRISRLFSREPDTDHGLGSHYIVDLVETGGAHVVSVVCENHSIPVFDMRTVNKTDHRPIRDIVKYILEASPPRCAIVLDLCANELAKKVRTRLMNTQCNLRYRRVVFCLTDHEMGDGPAVSMRVPGSVTDKMQLLVYHVPEHLQTDPGFSSNCLRQLAETMVDYTLFEPRVWRRITVDKTLAEFLSTALYQVVRRVHRDQSLGNGTFPSFELDWRRGLAPHLQRTLLTPPDALCPSIHRVIPIGVSSSDAIHAMEVAIPKDLQDPYAITVQSSAIDDRCGSIAITQPMRYTVVNVNCMINPGILVDVCRELRTGHKAVVAEVHGLKQQMDEKLTQMEHKHQKTCADLKDKHEESCIELKDKLSLIQNEMTTLVKRLSTDDRCNTTKNASATEDSARCAKAGCRRIVTKRFRSGKRYRQCSNCIRNS
jgi:hypothetical protein